ncbi:MAG: hypothetical protein LC667_18825 [Thioalkalivibrio sp.]|nr:hypothetical protein [Thioalkalivibrio sp.]
MLFKQAELARMQCGEITVAFRKWRRPTVASGGTLTTAIGVLSIDSVDRLEEEGITEADAARAGYADRARLLAELGKRSDGEVYRIRFHLKGPDPRIELRERSELDEADWTEVRKRLDRLDQASRTGAWTTATLEAIEEGEGTRAADLAPTLGQQKDAFKLNVRKLKKLGLTESLGTGYRVSPRGRAVLERLRSPEGR